MNDLKKANASASLRCEICPRCHCAGTLVSGKTVLKFNTFYPMHHHERNDAGEVITPDLAAA